MKLGVIGYGARIRHVIAEIIRQDPACRVTAIADIRMESIRRELSSSGPTDIRFYESPAAMLEAEELDGVLIGTRCSLHTVMALQVLARSLPLYLEKPVATTMEDLLRLKLAYESSRSPVVVSFPLRVTSIVSAVKEIIDSGRIGTVEHVQAVNNVPYGSVYYQNWYRDEAETGGLFLQKATHDFDYINYILGMRPTALCAMTSKQIFKGTKPAGLKCTVCSDNKTCPESTAFREDLPPEWEYCCYAEDTGNEDSGSALIRYESGMHVAYSQNFFARREAAARGARFLGHKGTVEFDFYTRLVKVIMHHIPRVETIEIGAGEDHFGGDAYLARNFTEVMRGEAASAATLDEGITSALLCLKAKHSAETGTFQNISFD
ncbi:Gfo/Idh/MocA family protein [Paenibacillus sp. FJAT-26967]|uniref:Gfo/Idh/MocA family protein n=1 Tax=Paenibacillus sp. FJAT-26967 TaxID=1729690 RepID=UPI00083919B6|nr:Gfo/Idh/MocA family oxidoreductase [Paenibacillus sp. FJAT-26967]